MLPQKKIRNLRSSNCWKCIQIVNPTTTTLVLYHFKSFTILSGGPFWLLRTPAPPYLRVCDGLIEHYLDIIGRSEFHGYNTRKKNTSRPTKVKGNWGKQRMNYQAVDDWNNFAIEIRNVSTLGQTKKCVFPVTCFLKLG